MMKIKFPQNLEYFDKFYTREVSPLRHIDIRISGWKKHNILEEEWMHYSIHTLDMVPTNWYVQQELRRTIVACPRLVEYFFDTFIFESKDYLVDFTSQWM